MNGTSEKNDFLAVKIWTGRDKLCLVFLQFKKYATRAPA